MRGNAGDVAADHTCVAVTSAPTSSPSDAPSVAPTSAVPTAAPSTAPSGAPTASPSPRSASSVTIPGFAVAALSSAVTAATVTAAVALPMAMSVFGGEVAAAAAAGSARSLSSVSQALVDANTQNGMSLEALASAQHLNLIGHLSAVKASGGAFAQLSETLDFMNLFVQSPLHDVEQEWQGSNGTRGHLRRLGAGAEPINATRGAADSDDVFAQMTKWQHLVPKESMSDVLFWVIVLFIMLEAFACVARRYGTRLYVRGGRSCCAKPVRALLPLVEWPRMELILLSLCLPGTVKSAGNVVALAVAQAPVHPARLAVACCTLAAVFAFLLATFIFLQRYLHEPRHELQACHLAMFDATQKRWVGKLQSDVEAHLARLSRDGRTRVNPLSRNRPESVSVPDLEQAFSLGSRPRAPTEGTKGTSGKGATMRRSSSARLVKRTLSEMKAVASLPASSKGNGKGGGPDTDGTVELKLLRSRVKAIDFVNRFGPLFSSYRPVPVFGPSYFVVAKLRVVALALTVGVLKLVNPLTQVAALVAIEVASLTLLVVARPRRSTQENVTAAAMGTGKLCAALLAFGLIEGTTLHAAAGPGMCSAAMFVISCVLLLASSMRLAWKFCCRRKPGKKQARGCCGSRGRAGKANCGASGSNCPAAFRDTELTHVGEGRQAKKVLTAGQ